jgi:hypothetical protein
MSCTRSVGVLALCAALAAGACGCNSARLVRWDGSSGVVAIPRNDNSWPAYNREHAEALMKEKCPHGYTVVSEEEVVTGQVQHTNVNTDRSGNATLAALHLDSVKTSTSETTSVEDRKEWRITFRPAEGPPAGMPGPITQTGAFVPVAPAPPGLPATPMPVGR